MNQITAQNFSIFYTSLYGLPTGPEKSFIIDWTCYNETSPTQVSQWSEWSSCLYEPNVNHCQHAKRTRWCLDTMSYEGSCGGNELTEMKKCNETDQCSMYKL